MFGFYLFALVLGGGLLLFSILGDVLGGGDAGDADLGDLGGQDVAHSHGHGDAAFKILSLRTAAYFLFGFGGVGTLMTLLTDAPILTVGLSLATGLVAAALVAAVFRWLALTESGEREEGEDLFVGLPARVTLPLAAGRSGKVMVQRGERSFELMARPFDEKAAGTESWRNVVVVEMERGTALVAPLEEITAEIPSRSEP